MGNHQNPWLCCPVCTSGRCIELRSLGNSTRWSTPHYRWRSWGPRQLSLGWLLLRDRQPCWWGKAYWWSLGAWGIRWWLILRGKSSLNWCIYLDILGRWAQRGRCRWFWLGYVLGRRGYPRGSLWISCRWIRSFCSFWVGWGLLLQSALLGWRRWRYLLLIVRPNRDILLFILWCCSSSPGSILRTTVLWLDPSIRGLSMIIRRGNRLPRLLLSLSGFWSSWGVGMLAMGWIMEVLWTVLSILELFERRIICWIIFKIIRILSGPLIYGIVRIILNELASA